MSRMFSSGEEDNDDSDLSILEWMNNFFSPLDQKDYVVSKRRGFSNFKPSSKIKPSSKEALYTCFLSSLDKHHGIVESMKRKERKNIQDEVKEHYLKPEIVPISGSMLPEKGKILLEFKNEVNVTRTPPKEVTNMFVNNIPNCSTNTINTPKEEELTGNSHDNAINMNQAEPDNNFCIKSKTFESSQKSEGKSFAVSQNSSSIPKRHESYTKTQSSEITESVSELQSELVKSAGYKVTWKNELSEDKNDITQTNESLSEVVPNDIKTTNSTSANKLLENVSPKEINESQSELVKSAGYTVTCKNELQEHKKDITQTNESLSEVLPNDIKLLGDVTDEDTRKSQLNPESIGKKLFSDIQKQGSCSEKENMVSDSEVPEVPNVGVKNVYWMEERAGEEKLERTREMFRKEQAFWDLKSSKELASCKWDISLFAEHVSRDNFTVLDSLIDLMDYEEDIDCYFNDYCKLELKKRLVNDSEVFADVGNFNEMNNGLKLMDLAKNDANETVVRSFLNHILAVVCRYLDVTLHPEQYLPGKEFSCPRCDYVFKMEGISIGSVEVKTANAINRNVIVQLLLQLLKMQTFNKSADLCYFGLLSDGYRYVFVLLKGTKFIFESEIDLKRQTYITATNEVVNMKEKVRIFYAKTWEELNHIVSRMVVLLQECAITLNKCTSGKPQNMLTKKENQSEQVQKTSEAKKHKIGVDNAESEINLKKTKAEVEISYTICEDGVINID